MNENYNGIAEDIRSEEEKAKDYKAKDLLAGATPLTFPIINRIKDFPFYEKLDQKMTNACVAFSIAKLLKVIFKKKGYGDFDFSPAPIYWHRSNKPEAGMNGWNALDITQKFFTCLIDYIGNDFANDQAIDSLSLDLQELARQAKEFLGTRKVRFTYLTDYSPNFRETAQYIKDYGGVISFVRTDYQNWNKDIPTLDENDKKNIGHSTCYHEYVNYLGKDYLLMDDSWGSFSSSEMGERGQRLIGEEFYNARMFFVGVLVLEEYGSKNVSYCQYTSIPAISKGYQGDYAIMLQKMLRDYGTFPNNVPLYPNFGSQTAKALLQWQLDNLDIDKQTLIEWGGNYFGQSSIDKIKELANNKLTSVSSSNNMKSYTFNYKKFLFSALGVFIPAFLISLAGGITASFTWDKTAILSLLSSAGIYGVSVLKNWITNNYLQK